MLFCWLTLGKLLLFLCQLGDFFGRGISVEQKRLSQFGGREVCAPHYNDVTEINRVGGAGLRGICGAKAGGLHGYYTGDDSVCVCVCLLLVHVKMHVRTYIHIHALYTHVCQ